MIFSDYILILYIFIILFIIVYLILNNKPIINKFIDIDTTNIKKFNLDISNYIINYLTYLQFI
jgi:hypothetical protein